MATENTEDLSLRDQLDAAFEQHSEDNDEPPREASTPAAAPAQAPAPKEDAAAPAPPEAGRARDEHGRFIAKNEAAPGPAQPAAAQQAAAPVSSPAPQPVANADLKPPSSWRPDAREKWAGVDPSVRAEVVRREGEFQQVLQHGAQMRQFVQQFERTVAPYEMFFRDENVTPLQAIQNLMSAATTLRIGNTEAKAALVANMIKQYSVDLETLDKTLHQMRQGGALPVQGQQQFRDPRMDQFLAEQNQIRQQLAAAQDAELRSQLNAFASKHEFYADVSDLMADIVELRARQGQPIDLQSAYDRACQMHEGVSTILAQRAAAAKANDSKAAVLRAKRAAVSVKGDPALQDGATVPKDDSVRASIEAAMESHQRM